MYFRLLIHFSFLLVLIVCECALPHKLDAPTSERLTNSLRENGVYEIVDRPLGKKMVKSKWVFRVKTNELGEVE